MKAQPTPVASGPSDGVTPRGRRPGNVVQVLQDTAACPVHVRPVFEDDVDKGEPEKGVASDHLGIGNRQHLGGDRVGDLVFDDLRSLAREVGVDDHLDIGEIRDGIQRSCAQRVDPPERDADRRQDDEEIGSE